MPKKKTLEKVENGKDKKFFCTNCGADMRECMPYALQDKTVRFDIVFDPKQKTFDYGDSDDTGDCGDETVYCSECNEVLEKHPVWSL